MIKKILDLTKNKGFMRYFINTSWTFFEKVLRIISALVVGVWVARYLGPEQLGILSYAQSIVALFLSFSTLGLDKILVRELVKKKTAKESLLGTAFLLQTIGSAVLLALLILSLNFIEGNPETRLIIIILGSVTFLQSFNVIGILFQSEVKGKFIALSGIAGLTFSVVAKIYLILTQAELIAFVYVIALENVISACVSLYYYSVRHGKISEWSFDSQLGFKLLKDSWPLLLNGVIVSIYMKIDQVMIKHFLDNEAVGNYAAAVRLSEAWYFIPTVICASLFPAIVNAKSTNEHLYYSRLQRLYDFMVYISVAIALPMSFLSNWLTDFLYGAEYVAAGSVLAIHIWTGVFVFLGVSRGGWIINENLQRYSSFYLGIGMLSNVILNLIMIPIFGVIGSALATLIAQSISVLFAPAIFKKTRLSFIMMIKSLLFLSTFSYISNKLAKK